jgi:hypothetical protein
MSRRQEVCRDFQRGNCRFGTRCKFSHQLPQNQQPQSNAFDSGRRHSPQQQVWMLSPFSPSNYLVLTVSICMLAFLVYSSPLEYNVLEKRTKEKNRL